MRRSVMALLLVAATVVPGARAVSALQKRPARATVYVVRPGDTLWHIAASVPGSDRRAVVHHLIELNQLSTPTLSPGQRLLLPRG